MRATYVARSAAPEWRERVHVLDPVLPAELLLWVASADIGALPIQRSTLNHYLSTPNKLFECLAAGIPVLASDFPAMRRIVMGDPLGPLGVVCDPASVDEVATALKSLLKLDSATADAMRARCLAAAQSRWNWEEESAALVALYRDLAPPRRDAPASVMSRGGEFA
jgi:glycosyltransferase involved in cell wall biosynthesis